MFIGRGVHPWLILVDQRDHRSGRRLLHNDRSDRTDAFLSPSLLLRLPLPVLFLLLSSVPRDSQGRRRALDVPRPAHTTSSPSRSFYGSLPLSHSLPLPLPRGAG